MNPAMKIDFSSLQKAIVQLEKSISFLRSDMSEENDDLREQFRAAVIQAFKFTYELAVKMVRRQLAQIVANPSELREMSFMELMRNAHEAGLIKAAPPFKIYREKRNVTTHTYDADKAEQILAIVDEFVEDMHYILIELGRRNA
jgi:nucleotidyltransferase substrate binding protein (TIGR01987 family)